MDEIDVIPALRTELPLHLNFNPGCAVAQAMDMTAFVEASGQRQSYKVGTCGGGIAQRDREYGLHFMLSPNHRQLRLFPEDPACFPAILRTLIVRRPRLNDRDHAAINFSDQRQRLLCRASGWRRPPVDGKANACLIAFLADQLGVAKAAIGLISGEASRAKRVRISGVAQAAVSMAFKLDD